MRAPTDVHERSVPALSVFAGSLIVLSAGVVFSFGGLAFRLTDDVTAWQYLIFRGLGALAVTTAILAVRYRHRTAELVAGVDPSHVAAGVIFAMISTIFIVSLEHASVAFVLFLQALAPLAAAYFSWLLMRERVSRPVWISTAVSIGGVGVMVSATVTDAVEPLGLIAVLIPILFGLYGTLIRRTARIDPQVPILIGATALVVAGTAVASLTEGLAVSLHDALIGLVAGSALLAIPLAFLNHATRVVPAPEMSLLLLSEIVLAPVWVWIFVDEEPHATTVVGGAIILVAVMGLLLWRRAHSATRTPVGSRRGATP